MRQTIIFNNLKSKAKDSEFLRDAKNLSLTSNSEDNIEEFANVMCTILEKLFAAKSFQAGNESSESSADESSSYSDDCVSSGSQSNSIKLNSQPNIQEPDLKLGQAKARRFKLMSAITKVLKIIDNGKACIISSLVLIDRLSTTGDAIVSEDLHWCE